MPRMVRVARPTIGQDLAGARSRAPRSVSSEAVSDQEMAVRRLSVGLPLMIEHDGLVAAIAGCGRERYRRGLTLG